MSGLRDAGVRGRAIDPAGSFAVAAPAGSGKTELLIQRTLSLLARVAQPECILGITFTRKAASEMRGRVIRALQDAERGVAAESAHARTTAALAKKALERDRELGWRLLDNPARLRFQTIDGLCRMLAGQLCLETGTALPAQVAADPGALYRQAAERVLGMLDGDGPLADALARLIAHLDGNIEGLCDLLAELLASRDSWLPIIVPGEETEHQYLADKVAQLVAEQLRHAHRKLAPFCADLEPLLGYALRHREGADWLDPALPASLPAAQPERLAQWLAEWRAVQRFLVTGQGGWRSGKVNVRMGFPPGAGVAAERKADYAALLAALRDGDADGEILAALNHVALLPTVPGAGTAEAIEQALFGLLPMLAASFDALSYERGETDYTATALAATRALGEPECPTPLALRLDYRIEHILVDEFQDTSAVQVELLRRLTAGWQAGDGRTLFVVGDGMQSIYGFRKANVGLFIRVRREGVGGLPVEAVDLSANFRSDRQIVDWVNHTFGRLLPAADNLAQGQVGYRDSQATRAASDWPVRYLGVADAAAEARAIAADIAAKLAAGERDLAILVRGRSHLREILPALRAREIAWLAQDIDPLGGRMAVLDAHSLTRALCVPADRIAWLAVLRAPWAGLDNADLLAVAQWAEGGGSTGGGCAELEGGDGAGDAEGAVRGAGAIPSTGTPPTPPTPLVGGGSIWCALQDEALLGRLSAAGRRTVLRVRRAFAHAFAQFGQRNLRAVVERLWRQLDGPQGVLAAHEHQDLANYFAFLEEVESGGMIGDWPACERRLQQLYARPQAGAAGATVEIMPLHQAKGLEFDHLYLPALERRVRAERAPLLLWWQREYEDGSEGYLLAAKPAAREAGEGGLYEYLRGQEAERRRQEMSRLLYVACTRARKSLFLSAVLRAEADAAGPVQIATPPPQSMLGLLWPLYAAEFSAEFAGDVAVADSGPESSVLAGIRRLPWRRALPEIGVEVGVEGEVDEAGAGAGGLEVGGVELGDGVAPRGGGRGRDETAGAGFSAEYLARVRGRLLHHSLMRAVRERIADPTAADFEDDWRRGLDGLGLAAAVRDRLLAQLAQMLAAVAADARGRWLLDWNHAESAAELEVDYLDAAGAVRRVRLDRTFVADGVRWVVDYKSSALVGGETLAAFLRAQAVRYREQLVGYAGLFAERAEPVRAMLYFPAVAAAVEVGVEG